MSSPLFEEWVKEEREEAANLKTRKNIIEVLVERFDIVPKAIREDVMTVRDKEILDELFRKAIKIPSVEEFHQLLNKYKN